MGKRSRKMRKQRKARQERNIAMENAATKTDLEHKLAREEYAEVINDLAELIKKKCYDAETMYAGAYSYFMLGDYKRAADWVNNTLQFAPQHLKARVLLARLCFIESRESDGLKVLEFIAESYAATLTDAEKEDIKNIASFYVYSDENGIKANYPALAALFGLVLEGTQTTATQCAGRNASQQTATTQDAPALSASQDNAADKSKVSQDAAQVIDNILAQPSGLADKVKVLNAFAGGLFVEDKYAGAEALLTAALKIDPASDETLRNMAILQAVKGDKVKAFAFASKLSTTHFVLLQQIKNIVG